MKADSLMFSDTAAWVRVVALEKKWGRPRDEILAEALHECRGVRSELSGVLKAWQYPNPGDLKREVERLFGEGWMIRRKTDA